MSHIEDGEVLRPMLLRTSTPAPSEKVLLYLETMGRDGPQTPYAPPSNPPSDLGSEVGARMQEQLQLEEEYMGRAAPMPVLHDEDVDSNFQEQSSSDVGHGPGPEEGPHAFYPSYGSSFGNMGPLPGSRHESYQPPTAVPLPKSVMSPKTGTKSVPLQDGPASPRRSNAPSRVSQRSRSTIQDGTERQRLDDVPVPSKTPSNVAKSHASGRSRGKTIEGDEARSTVSKHHTSRKSAAASQVSQAPSLSPSDSPSNIGMKRAQAASRAQSRAQEQAQHARDPSPVRSAARSQQVHSPQPSRAFSPHRHNQTGEDLFQLAVRNAALSPSRSTGALPPLGTALGLSGPSREPSLAPDRENDRTPRAMSPDAGMMTMAEEQVITDLLSRTPNRTSYAPSTLEPNIENSHYHDMEMCVLLHALDDPNQHEVAKKALRKAVRQRVKRLGMKYDHDSIKQYRKSFHDHDPTVHLQAHMTGMSEGTRLPQDPPEWAKELMHGIAILTGRVDSLGPKIESIKGSHQGSYIDDGAHGYTPSERERLGSPTTQTVPIHGQPTGTMAESVFNAPETEVADSMRGPGMDPMHLHDGSVRVDEDEFIDDETQRRGVSTRGDDETHLLPSEYLRPNERHESPGAQYLEEELYKLRVRPGGSQSGYTHKTWEVTREQDEYDDDGEHQIAATESGMPEITGGTQTGYTEGDRMSPPLPPIPQEQQQQQDNYGEYAEEQVITPPPWQRIHQRLLNWAIVWPMSEFDAALNSTTRGQQIDEIALSIWSTQTYKRYVRSKMTDSPNGRVDRLFVPPNMADAISNAVYNGRHGDACAMLRDLWNPFGFDGMPRLLIVLAKHRSDENHWVVHRFSLPDGTLATYDTYPERCLPDGRPLGWWFAIRIAWPNALYPSPDHLMQKMVRLHRPMQLGIDNSVAAAGIWRNLLMGSRAERSLDLERLRDLINTEVKNLRQRKHLGKLSISPNARPTQWMD